MDSIFSNLNEEELIFKNQVFDYGIGAQPGQTISFGLEWGKISKEDRQRLMQERGGGGRRGMGGGRGGRGGGRGGQRGSIGGSYKEPPDEWEVWMKTQLASPPAG